MEGLQRLTLTLDLAPDPARRLDERVELDATVPQRPRAGNDPVVKDATASAAEPTTTGTTTTPTETTTQTETTPQTETSSKTETSAKTETETTEAQTQTQTTTTSTSTPRSQVCRSSSRKYSSGTK